MAVRDEDMVVKSRDYLLTEAEINREATAQEIADFLHRRRVTGEVKTHHREGGIRQVIVTQKTPLNADEGKAVREILDME